MNPLRLQGLFFCLVACFSIAFCAWSPRFDASTELVVVGLLIALLGVPHGAFDAVFAGDLYGLKTRWSWLVFVLLYVGLALLVVVFWWLVPMYFLLGFLGVSAWHFSGDLQAPTSRLGRVVYGGAPLIFPALLHEPEVTRLFSYLVSQSAAQGLARGLSDVSLAWLFAAGLALVRCLRSDPWASLEIGCVSALALLTPPLMSFTIFFCFMHSPRHMIRTHRYAGLPTRQLVGRAALPMVAVAGGSGVAWCYLNGTPLDARVVQVVFVGLAALTAPHMVLVEQIRHLGWLKLSRPSQDSDHYL